MADKKPDGGAAFPREDYQADNAPGQRGMSLRDYFAGQALAGNCGFSVHEGIPIKGLVSEAYAIADAMLAEREK